MIFKHIFHITKHIFKTLFFRVLCEILRNFFNLNIQFLIDVDF